jgi:DNA-binding transcriptional ArsR family regulator
MPDYESLSIRLKLLAHPERLRILDVLRREPECVCHLEALLDKPQPYVSQQLRLLREAKVITDHKQGQNVFYSIGDAEILTWLEAILGPADAGTHRSVPNAVVCNCPKCAPVFSSLAVMEELEGRIQYESEFASVSPLVTN